MFIRIDPIRIDPFVFNRIDFFFRDVTTILMFAGSFAMPGSVIEDEVGQF